MCVVYVCPHRAARAFGEYLSHTHPENRNGSGQRLAILPFVHHPVLHIVLILPVPGSAHLWLKSQAVIISVSRADNQRNYDVFCVILCSTFSPFSPFLIIGIHHSF